MADFNPNGTLGRIYTLTGICKPQKMLTKQPGICEAYLKNIFKEYDEKDILKKMADKSYQGNVNAGNSFRNQCEALPSQMPEQDLNDLQKLLNDYVDHNMPPEDIYRIRHLHNLYERVYRPGPRLEAPITEAEQQWLLQNSNDIVMALLAPPFNLPAFLTKMAGGTPQQVSGALETGAVLSDMAGMAAGMKQKPPPAPLLANEGVFIQGKGLGNGRGVGRLNTSSICRGDPVDVGTGSLLQQLSVLTLPGSLPLTLSRFYRSRSSHGGVFGPKWTDEWSRSLHIQGNDLHFTDQEGVVLYYPLPRDGIFQQAANSRQPRYRLTGDISAELTVFDRHTQQTLRFAPSATGTFLLSALHDQYGNRIDFIRTNDLLTEIRHSDGYTLALDWQNRQLMCIDLVTPQRQRLVTCHYDSNGFLAECDTFQFSHLWHEYSPEGFMTRWRDTDKTCVDISYDVQGRVISTQSTEGYYSDHFIYNDEEKCTTYQDAEGGESHYWYDDEGLVTRTLDELGRESSAHWDNTLLLSRTDALGRTTEYHYNDEGDIRHVALPGGHSLWYEYNDAGQLTRLTTPGDQQWLWAYDELGSVVSLTDPQGRSQQFSYSEQGDLLAHILPGGATWRWSHDALHQVRETTAPNGGITHTEQDMLGCLLSVKDPLGFTTQFRHSKKHAGPQGSIEEINRPDGVRELMHQNSEKLTESFTDGEGKTTRYEYGAFDLLTAVIRPDGERLECRYDKLTRLTEIINAAGEHYRLTYDKAGQLIADTDFTGRTLNYRYDAAGRCICTSFPDGTHLNRVYNVTDQVVREDVTQGDSTRVLSTTLFRYDTLCRLVEAKNDDATVIYEYDEAGRLCAETINGRRTEYRFDAQQDYVTQRTTAGITEYFTRGLMGELTQWQIADHAPLTFTHDLRGHEITRQNDTGFRQQLGYTPTGMLTQQQVGNPAELNPHDRRNKTLHRQWLYDKAYNLTMIADSLRGTAVHTLTANDQISHATWTGNSSVPMREERFTYDQNLNITRRQTWVNDVMESEAYQQQQHGRVASREHKAWRHTTSRINPDSGKPEDGKFVRVVNEHNITWKYDVNGRLVEKLVDKGGYRPLQWRYRWDARSQLTALETPDGERWEYRYDPSGRRISKRCTNREKTGYDFHWNGDQLTEEIPVYAGCPPAYDDSIRWIYELGSFTPLARYEKGQLHYAVTDTVGRIQELLTEDGTIVWRGKQQLWGREESANDDKLSCRLRFPGQYEDTESGLHYNRFRYYDSETGQYISADPIGLAGGVNPYGYVHNPLSWVDPLGLACVCPKDVDALRTGGKNTTINVKTKADADALLKAAFPDYQKVNGVGPEDAVGLRKKRKMDRFKEGGAYHKDYSVDPTTGRVRGHGPNDDHGNYPHINIKRRDGVKVVINITGNP
ncbi:hypothetical protein M976_00168 [Buttiauxella ferragutiae ATCC 51602]|uniref:Rhs family protein n=2 Tax=Buttiauxella TaxID=82976 RepID=A0ABX2WEG7_9ENTR|nr:RHS repeat-associated core domain-containing protein [Buttiauxella ferragutiae]OAT33421.1 hypothetical protein M976_00168 [Buttiauxella ferragutiae ATCC 51602]